MTIRPVKFEKLAVPHIEGAGVHLNRVFGFAETEPFDPFLMMDDFRNDDPDKFVKGFPWHPHRGIETITYVIKGSIEHKDSLGNEGMLSDGDIQWMTAGSGIIHQEMPFGNNKGQMHGFQLWANLSSSQKMTMPRYQDIGSEFITKLLDDDGVEIRVIAGDYRGYKGPVDGIESNPSYLDIIMPPNIERIFPFETSNQGFAYIFEGSAKFHNASQPFGINVEKEFDGNEVKIRDYSGNKTLVVFGDGQEVKVNSGEMGVRFLLISGKPLREPVAWHGPIVMNTQEELNQAFEELNNGTFIKTSSEKWSKRS